MIKNGYAIFALLNLIIIGIAIIGVFVHIYAIFTTDESILTKYMIYKDISMITTVASASVFSIVLFLLLNKYSNWDIQQLMDCCKEGY